MAFPSSLPTSAPTLAMATSIPATAPPQPTPTAEKRECEICCDHVDAESLILPCRLCAVRYCISCLEELFINSIDRENNFLPPRCCGLIQLHTVLSALDDVDANTYRNRMKEWLVRDKVYCPVPRCSAFIPEDIVKATDETGAKKAKFECPECHAGICAKCRQIAHEGLCDTSAKDEEKAMLARFRIKQCPNCKQAVKKMYGCSHMECRCGAHFCWSCNLSIDVCDGTCRTESEDEEDFDDDDDDNDDGGHFVAHREALARRRRILQQGVIAQQGGNTGQTNGGNRNGQEGEATIRWDEESEPESDVSGPHAVPQPTNTFQILPQTQPIDGPRPLPLPTASELAARSASTNRPFRMEGISEQTMIHDSEIFDRLLQEEVVRLRGSLFNRPAATTRPGDRPVNRRRRNDPDHNDLDAGGEGRWANADEDFGEEPREEPRHQLWSCPHKFDDYRLDKSNKNRGNLELMGCNRCWSKVEPSKGKEEGRAPHPKRRRLSGKEQTQPSVDVQGPASAMECIWCSLVVCPACKAKYYEREKTALKA